MKTIKQATEYQSPQIEKIEIDNEVALQLESTPPKAPGEAGLNPQDYYNNDPFKGVKA
ncbi:MAG: hypothetical protein WCL70_00810 [Paludibacter sp.]